MEQRELGRSGIAVSRIVLGCGNFGGIGSSPAHVGKGTPRDEAFRLLDAAWEMGITTLDTADAYGLGRSEEYIGAWLRTKPEARDRAVIATKTFNPMDEAADHGLGAARIRRQVETSLRRLGVERLPLYLAHDFDPHVPQEETLGAFDALVRGGTVGAVGASNFTAEQLAEALELSALEGLTRYEWVQNGYSLLERGDRETVFPLCHEHGLGYTPFSPLAGGWLTGKYRRGEPLPAGSRMTLRPEGSEGYRTDATFDALEAFERAASGRGVSMAALAIAWLLHLPEITAVVVGPSRLEHLAPVQRGAGRHPGRRRARRAGEDLPVSVLVLGEDDVRATLDMPRCIAAMEGVLAALARGEVSMPLRTIFRVPDETVLGLGLMPAHRGGAEPVISLKEVVVAPGNSARGLDPHQGAVLLHDGTTGQLVAVLNASPITEIRTAAVSAVATRLLARPRSRQVAILGSGVQGRSHAVAMREVLPEAELRVWSRDPAHAEALALEAHGLACASVAEALAGADVVCTCTASPEPIVALGDLAPGAHVNAVGSSGTWARELEADVVAAASLFVDRRESTVNESGDYLGAVAERGIGPEHILAELGELLVGAHPGRRSDEELTVFKSLGLAAEDLAAAALCVEVARERGIGVEVAF